MAGCEKDEALDKDNLTPLFNASYFSPEGLANQQACYGARRRLLDTAEYLFEIQNKYYVRFAKAIRETGYKGLLVGSNWQAADGVSHLHNLLSDRSVGRMDRHNYFGGAGAAGMNVGVMEDNSTMLWQPGSTLLSSGLQQMVDRPFALSEWMEQAPNEWVAEGAPVIGFYGLGLQGWDAAYEGNNTEPKFDATYETWLHTQTPINIGLYPAVARSIYRGDVKEGGVIASLRFSLEDLRAGTKGLVGFAPNKEFALGDVRLQVDNKFVVLLVTALDRDKTLASTKSALITAIARARNTGMAYYETRSLTATGTAPVLLEPVLGSVTFGRKVSRVCLLDHDGRRTDKAVPARNGRIVIDGVRDRTMYYEAVFE